LNNFTLETWSRTSLAAGGRLAADGVQDRASTRWFICARARPRSVGIAFSLLLMAFLPLETRLRLVKKSKRDQMLGKADPRFWECGLNSL
jgi:hypothetical protein